MQPKPHVLIAEDEVLAAMALESILIRAGFRVTCAYDGEKALAAQAVDPPDILVTDIRMPRMDGRQLIREVRQTLADLPIIIMTGFISRTGVDELRGEGSGPIEVIPKPISPREIVATIRRLIAQA
ncbi:response regulator [Indioceanicola profundi]|uniref:response regulator n=1 Tax=Indioceanicola profundi TaxID=2220096 RepID=UPI000E6AD408|nr:response regulator [Indioceanicola profundi]